MNRTIALRQCLELNSFSAMQTIGHSICANCPALSYVSKRLYMYIMFM